MPVEGGLWVCCGGERFVVRHQRCRLLVAQLEHNVVQQHQEGVTDLGGCSCRVGGHRSVVAASSVPSGGQAAQGRVEIIGADAPRDVDLPPPARAAMEATGDPLPPA